MCQMGSSAQSYEPLREVLIRKLKHDDSPDKLLKKYINDLGMGSTNYVDDFCRKNRIPKTHPNIVLLRKLLALNETSYPVEKHKKIPQEDIIPRNDTDSSPFAFCLGLLYAKTEGAINADQQFEAFFSPKLLYSAAQLNHTYGQIYYHLKKWVSSIAYLTTAIRLDPQNIYALIMRAKAYHHIEQYDLAIEDYDKAIADKQISQKLDLEERYDLFMARDGAVADSLLKHYRYDIGLLTIGYVAKMCNKYHELEAHPSIILLNILLSLETGQEDKFNYYHDFTSWGDVPKQHSIYSLPKYSLHSFCLGLFYEKGPKASLSNSYFSPFEQPNFSAKELFVQGQRYYHMLKWNPAIRSFSNAIRLDPKNVYALIMRGKAYQYTKKYTLAMKDYNEVIQRKFKLTNCEWADLYTFRGVLFNNMRPPNFNKALQNFYEAVKCLPMSRTYTEIGQAYSNSLRLHIEVVTVHTHEVMSLNTSKAHGGLIIRKLLTKKEWTYLLCFKNKDSKKKTVEKIKTWEKMAQKNFDSALKLDPKNDVAYRQRAQFYFFFYQFDKALEDINVAIRLRGKRQDYIELRNTFTNAKTLIESGNFFG